MRYKQNYEDNGENQKDSIDGKKRKGMKNWKLYT